MINKKRLHNTIWTPLYVDYILWSKECSDGQRLAITLQTIGLHPDLTNRNRAANIEIIIAVAFTGS